MSNEGYPATNTQPHLYMQLQGCQGLGYHSAPSHPYSGAASVNNAVRGVPRSAGSILQRGHKAPRLSSPTNRGCAVRAVRLGERRRLEPEPLRFRLTLRVPPSCTGHASRGVPTTGEGG
ncbi:hypothetical protein NEOLEDRAFT_1246463 [Neolentinus lepideus HHB14362 ss-1]|uniref:Uncharacterized protein n=1 Tax=Neolentinus lepideus HHB14362 ss-1 TaxID=1314782 RepID=A0A165MIR5_9AGAM|nr:hypothetical protein NEOLEDRAFT_1246463 [Neolentinus lepideus HHB14362 ss-1]